MLIRLSTRPIRLLQCQNIRGWTQQPLGSARVYARRFCAAQRRAERAADQQPAQDLQRNNNLAQLSPKHVDHFKAILQDESAIIYQAGADENTDLEPFNTDWMRKYRGRSQLVLRPTSTEQVSQILRYCNAQRLAVVPQGGNTGLVGGSVPVFDEVILSMSRMNQIRHFDDTTGVLVLDAGVILENADGYLAKRQHIFPLDLGAKGSCHVGGNIATNAGGLRLLRYGSLHGSILGLEIVLPDGTIVNDLSTLKKNNTGYDLKHLFIGGEGSIGIITAASIACPQRPKAVNVAYFGLPSYEHVKTAFKTAKAHLGEILSAFELMDGRTQDIVHKITGKKRPLDRQYPFYCLIETSGSNAEHDTAKLEAFIEYAMTEDIIADGAVAQDQSQINTLWGWREGIVEALSQYPVRYGFDLSIPLDEFYDIVDATRQRLISRGLLGEDATYPAVDVMGYGHVGDGNIHLNIVARERSVDVDRALEPFVYEWVASRRGSISAEHGLGIAKSRYVGYNRDETILRLMRQIKSLYDPNGIMNPYKYIQ